MLNKGVEQYQALVDEINHEYQSLQSLSNDELRSKLVGIQNYLIGCDNKDEALSDCLSEVYAIVKETERRFSRGPLIVTVNDCDRKWAEQFDFITIEGDNAIYYNKWVVRETIYTWNMVPYDEQLLGGICLHYGYATEMATGEGKTLVATLPVFLNALTHEGVHLMTSNEYLACRDYEQTRPIYMFHGLTVGLIDQVKDKSNHIAAYEMDITFGSTSMFIFDYLNDHIALRLEDCFQLKPFHFAVIDELDSTLIDEAQTPHILGGSSFFDDSDIYKAYKPIIEELLEDKTLYNQKDKDFTEKGISWLKVKLDNNHLFSYNRLYEAMEKEELSESGIKSVKEQIRIQQVLRNLLFGYINYKRDVHYIVENGQVIIIDRNTGRKKDSYRWQNGRHTAVEVKENVKPSLDFDGSAVISVKNYFRLYPKVCGMSGTIWQVKDELKDIYKLDTVVLPTHLPVKRVDHQLYVTRCRTEKLKALVDVVNQVHSMGRPILIGCYSELENEEVCSLLKGANLPFNKLSAKTLDKEAAIIAQAGKYGCITVSTNIAGRGTDIKLSKDALEAGGLYVIGTSPFHSIRVDRQLKGRAGRQGDPGDSLFFTSPEDEIMECLSKEELENFKHKVLSNLLSEEEQRTQYHKTQRLMETFLSKTRMYLAEKDDIVDTFRKHFYQERNDILVNDDRAESQYLGFLNNLGYSRERIDEHIHQLYLQIKRITLNIVNNEVGGVELIRISEFSQRGVDYNEIEIPYSEEKHLFIQTYQREKLLESEKYFRDQFLKQSMLQVYDQCWTKFVKYILEDLDQHEIQLLPSEYKKIYRDINQIIIKRLINTIVPVKEPADRDVQSIGFVTNIPIDHRATIPKAGDLCPCGSGKKYCECHGRSIRNKNKYRR